MFFVTRLDLILDRVETEIQFNSIRVVIIIPFAIGSRFSIGTNFSKKAITNCCCCFL
jgi:hypothetical protein